MNGKIAGLAGVFLLGGIVTLFATQHATAQFMNQQIDNYIKEQDPKSNVHIDYKILNKNILAQQGELTFMYIDRDVKKKGKLKTYTTILPLYTSTRFEADDNTTKEFFDNFNITEANFSTFFKTGTAKLVTDEQKPAPFHVSLFGFDQNDCEITNANLKAEIDDLSNLTNNKFVSKAVFKTKKLRCSEALPRNNKIEETEYLSAEDVQLTTSLNQIISKDFDLKAPEFFAAKVEKVTFNGDRNPLTLKAVDISRNVDVEKDEERVYINLFIANGVPSKFHLEGIGDRYLENESEGLKKGKYFLQMQGPFFTSMPYVHNLYKAGFLQENKQRKTIESNISYEIDLFKMPSNMLMGATAPDAVKLIINGKESTPERVFAVMMGNN